MICHVELNIGTPCADMSDEKLVVDLEITFLDGPLKGKVLESKIDELEIEGR